MDQVIKILALTNNQILISEVVEVAAMVEPYLKDYTRDSTLMMGSDKILTIAEPTPTLLEKYLDLLKE